MLRLGLAQTGFPEDGDALAQAASVAGRAREEGVTLLAFPENLMHPRELSAQELVYLAEPLDGPFVNGMAEIARQYGIWMAFTFNEAIERSPNPYNTAVVVDSIGCIQGTYHKCHLYDAHNVRESDRLLAGDALCHPIQTPFCMLGLGICYDLRFPEVARSLALAGCDLILVPAAWHDGPNKLLHWKTLLRARAIENECFVAGVCHAGARYVERGFVFDPLGNEVVAGDEELLVCDIDLEAVRAARDAMPIFDHRRASLYEGLYR